MDGARLTGPEPNFDVAQLAHVEILTPKPEATIWFFTQLLGLDVTEQVGQSAYLRAYEDWYHHTLKVTEAPQAGLGHIAWRTSSAPALGRRVAVLEASGLGRGWIEGERGHGPAYRFVTPEGHPMEVLWEVEYAQIPEAQRSLLRNRPQQRPLRGVPARRLDHVNIFAREVTPVRDFLIDTLGFRLRENRVIADGTETGTWLSVSPLVHEIAIMRDRTGARGRFHHLAYWYGYPQHLYDAVEVFNDHGIFVESGPGKHGISQAMYLYVYEPGGNRVELFGDVGHLIFDPSWRPVTWTDGDVKSSAWVGMPHPPSFFSYGTPPLEVGPEALKPTSEHAIPLP